MLTEEQIRKIKELLARTSLSRREIAAELGISYNTFLLRMAASRLKIGRVLVNVDDPDFTADAPDEAPAFATSPS